MLFVSRLVGDMLIDHAEVLYAFRLIFVSTLTDLEL
jgi:hypothetical protein